MNCCKNTESFKALQAEQGVLSLLGLCQRAGRLISGGDAVQKALLAGQVRLLLVADDLSENSLKKLRLFMPNVSQKSLSKLSIWQFGSKVGLGSAAGKPARGIWAVCDENFADGMAKKLAMLVKADKAHTLDKELCRVEQKNAE